MYGAGLLTLLATQSPALSILVKSLLNFGDMRVRRVWFFADFCRILFFFAGILDCTFFGRIFVLTNSFLHSWGRIFSSHTQIWYPNSMFILFMKRSKNIPLAWNGSRLVMLTTSFCVRRRIKHFERRFLFQEILTLVIFVCELTLCAPCFSAAVLGFTTNLTSQEVEHTCNEL